MPVPLRLTPSALRFIGAARIAHLATADEAGQPHVVPICFVFDGKHFFSPIDEKPKRTAPEKLKRVSNIAQNSRVSLIIDRYDEDWSRLAYVLITGKARLLRSGADHRRAVALLRRKYRQYREMALEQRPVIRIAANRASSWPTI